VTRNPLLVQFWLLGVDAARGDLAALGFERTSAPFGSSAYSRGNLTLHSAGLWLTRPDGTWQYARWRETFSRAPSVRASAKQPDADASPAPWAVPERAVVVQRAEGLRAVRASFVAYETDLARRRGRSYRAELLSGRLPPRGRRLVPAWEGWVARHVVFGPAVLSGDLDAIVKINYQ
jgi:hypothetical protein